MGLLQGLILYASTFIVIMGVGLIWDVWRHKDCFELAARSPMLLCLAGAAHVALVFLQMTAVVRTPPRRVVAYSAGRKCAYLPSSPASGRVGRRASCCWFPDRPTKNLDDFVEAIGSGSILPRHRPLSPCSQCPQFSIIDFSSSGTCLRCMFAQSQYHTCT